MWANAPKDIEQTSFCDTVYVLYTLSTLGSVKLCVCVCLIPVCLVSVCVSGVCVCVWHLCVCVCVCVWYLCVCVWYLCVCLVPLCVCLIPVGVFLIPVCVCVLCLSVLQVSRYEAYIVTLKAWKSVSSNPTPPTNPDRQSNRLKPSQLNK